MAFFDTLDKYELKQLGLDDDEIGTLDKVLSHIPRPFRAVIKNRIVDELKETIKNEGVDVIKSAIKSLKDALAVDPNFVKNFKDMFKALTPAASNVVTYILSFKKRAANANSDVCDLCRAQGRCSPDIWQYSVCSVFWGNSVRTCPLVRRNRKGRSARAKSVRVPSSSLPFFASVWNFIERPNMPGLRNSNNDQSSPRWFSTGVPVMARRWSALRSREALAAWEVWVLMACDSSKTT